LELRQKAVPYRRFTHTAPVASLEQAASQRAQHPDQIVRSILFRLPENHYCLVLINGPRQIDWKALRSYLNTNRLTLADPSEVQDVTGFKIGSVGPFGLKTPLRILLDRRILAWPEISIGSGRAGTALILSPQALLQALPPCEFFDF
jgi:Cys-tRNA(Pro) deacylase